MHVHVVNLSTLVSDEQALVMTKAVNAQVRGDFARAWDRERDAVHFSSAKELEGCAESVIAIVNAPPAGEEGVLGEHTDLGDQVIGYVYCAPVLDSGGGVFDVPIGAPRGCAISAVLSHEVLELLGNPSVNRWADDELGDAVAMEMCDPCEADAYKIAVTHNGQIVDVVVSDFVLPAYFDPASEGPFDFMGTIKVAFGLAPEGYQIVRDSTTNERAVWGVVCEWKQRGKASKLSRTSRLCSKSKVASILDAVREAREAAAPSVPLEDAHEALEEMQAAVARPAPPAPKKQPIRRVRQGPGGRSGLKPTRRVKVG